MTLYAGTSGYSYKEWKGSFYPEKTKPDQMLQLYGEQLNAVEINNTFYRLPKASVLETWSHAVPDAFRFSIKASRRITHLKRLKEVNDETTYLLDTVRVLGDKLGVVLFQLPPNMKLDLERFDRFLAILKEHAGIRAVFEFRHESWQDDEVTARLRDANCALVLADTDEAPDLEITPTADFGYLRLRREAYDDDAIATWREKVEAQSSWSDAYVFFKHEDGAVGPEMAKRFLE